jgi:sulfide:quinone oxidoreductase
VEFGRDQVGRVDVTFMAGQQPTGGFEGPSRGIAVDKVEFGATRVQRWFGREWLGAGRPLA